jgi:very-short-patch-repair endonuclease
MSAEMFDAIETHVEERRAYITEMALRLVALQQSPIEEKMALALLANPLSSLSFLAVQSELPDANRTGLFIVPQLQVGRYRADFAIVMQTDGHAIRLVVECDGHDFHEKTKEQAAHDKARDRYFLEKQWPVMRFTGSEIHKNADKCAHQVMLYVLRIIARGEGKEHVVEALEWGR